MSPEQLTSVDLRSQAAVVVLTDSPFGKLAIEAAEFQSFVGLEVHFHRERNSKSSSAGCTHRKALTQASRPGKEIDDRNIAVFPVHGKSQAIRS
jgi:hypothetical protein